MLMMTIYLSCRVVVLVILRVLILNISLILYTNYNYSNQWAWSVGSSMHPVQHHERHQDLVNQAPNSGPWILYSSVTVPVSQAAQPGMMIANQKRISILRLGPEPGTGIHSFNAHKIKSANLINSLSSTDSLRRYMTHYVIWLIWVTQ